MRPAPLLLSALLLLLSSAACQDPSDEDQVRAAVQRAITAVHDKKPSAVVEEAAPDFRGPGNANLEEVRRIITGYLLTQGWVRAFERKLSVTVAEDATHAHVDLELVLARGNKVERLEDVVPTQATAWDMDLELE
jgi:hypothetical protein